MRVRQVLSAAGLSVSLIALSAGAIFADTVGDSTDRVSAAAGWENESGAGSVSAFSDPAEGTIIDYVSFREFEVTCEDGSGGHGTVDFYGQGPASLTIPKKLGSAVASGSVTGTQNTFDPCTGETTSVEATFHVSFALTATTGASTTVTKTKETSADGTKLMVTVSRTIREATGTVRIDSGDPITPDSGEIQHIVVTTKTFK